MTAVSLGQQIDAMHMACTRQQAAASGQTVRPMMTRSQEEHQLARLQAVTRTLVWLQSHEAAIRAFLALPASSREAVLMHATTMAEMCLELHRREALAAAGGPKR